MTEYVVLSLGDDGHWSERATVKARSARSAIRIVLDGTPGAAGVEFVAPPLRSWQPVKVSVETKQTLRFD